jgi:hypothetical protein
MGSYSYNKGLDPLTPQRLPKLISILRQMTHAKNRQAKYFFFHGVWVE